jgi:putative pyruvate formate lyase activating enzyme
MNLVASSGLERLISRPELARARAAEAQASLADCRLCSHDCGVNRLIGKVGVCGAGATARVFSAQVECGDELELIPTFAIALSGCDLRCDFCITGAASWNPMVGEGLSIEVIARRATAALAGRACTVMFLGGEPTIHLPAVLEIVAALPGSAKLVWKTNAHASTLARQWLQGLFEVWLADYKFGNDSCAARLAKISDYTRIVRQNLLWAAQQGELIVRHLLMPRHLNCCWRPIAEWLAQELPKVKVSLRTGYWPAWHAGRHLELKGTVSPFERRTAERIGAELGLRLIP